MSENPPTPAAGPSTAPANATTPTAAASREASGANDMIKALGNMLKTQTGESLSNERISQLLLQNMAQLVQQGKLTQKQIIEVLYDVAFTVIWLAKSLDFRTVERIRRYP